MTVRHSWNIPIGQKNSSMIRCLLNGFGFLNRIIFERIEPWKGRTMRTEYEVNTAMELYSAMVLRLCGVYLKNDSDAEDIFQTVFLKYALHERRFESAEH